MASSTILLPSLPNPTSSPPSNPSTSIRKLPMSTSPTNSISTGVMNSVPVVQLTPGRKKTSLLTRNIINSSSSCNNEEIDFKIKDYQDIVAKSALENELLHAGYVSLNKIVIQDSEGNRKTQYIKALNKKGQKVFILLDVTGYITTRNSDLILIESTSTQMIPYSLKMGAMDCAGTEVYGIAFECSSNAICILSTDLDHLIPKEANFSFIQSNNESNGLNKNIPTLKKKGDIISYPIIKLSEIRANPALILENTDLVTRRLRNATYKMLLDDLQEFDQSITELRNNFDNFMSTREKDASRLNNTLNQLDQWNEIYITHPPTTDDFKERYRNLQFNLSQRNEYIEVLLRSMKKISELHTEIDSASKTIAEVTEFFNKEFVYLDCSIPQ